MLGPLAERSLRQSLNSSQGDPMTFLERPISLTCVLIAIALASYPIFQGILRKKKKQESAA